jgi:hypothetical protein
MDDQNVPPDGFQEVAEVFGATLVFVKLFNHLCNRVFHSSFLDSCLLIYRKEGIGGNGSPVVVWG